MRQMTESLAGKVALVTGGGSGIGRASACAFAREGARVVVADVAIEGGEETVRLIEESGGEAVFVKADVSKRVEVEAMVNTGAATWGRLDCAHNNAGLAEFRASTADLTEEVWDHIIAVNLKGVWLSMKYEIPQMLKHGRGAIVNTASVVGLVGVGYQPAYVASKHGVVGLTKAAALEYAKAGIRVNAVCPGAVRTPAIEWFIGSNPQLERRLKAQHPIGRLGTAEEIAATVVWLCSDAASFITGHAMAVDGGVTAQ
jgi:NAD(P)-dependent dehydrogenase (short-subunit alcohol dehydrogenase family)